MLRPRHASFEARSKAWCARIACCLLLGAQSARPEDTRCLLEYAPGPADNPLKGLVPYASAGGNASPTAWSSRISRSRPSSPAMTLYIGRPWRNSSTRLPDAATRPSSASYLEWPGREARFPRSSSTTD